MINNPDILLQACNEVFTNDTVTTQQQYYQQPVQAASPCQQQTSQLQQQLQRTQIIDVLVKELNELKTKVKQLEEEIHRQAQMPSIQFPAIRMPIRLDIINSEPSAVGLGIAKKEIQATKRKKRLQNKFRLHKIIKQPFSGLPPISERLPFLHITYSPCLNSRILTYTYNLASSLLKLRPRVRGITPFSENL